MIKIANAVHPSEIIAEEFLGPANLEIISFTSNAKIDFQTVVALTEGRIAEVEK